MDIKGLLPKEIADKIPRMVEIIKARMAEIDAHDNPGEFLAEKFPLSTVDVGAVTADRILDQWDWLHEAEATMQFCGACTGVEECGFTDRWGQGHRLELGPDLHECVAPCAYMLPVIQERKRIRKLVAARLEEHFWKRTLASYTPDHPSQDVALERCCEFADQYKPGKTQRGLILSGGVGTGKTHLAAGIVIDVVTAFPEAKPPVFLRWNRYLDELRSTFNREDEDLGAKLDEATAPPLLVIDDLGAQLEWGMVDGVVQLSPSEEVKRFEREKLYEILDTRYASGRPTIITTNLPPMLIEQAFGPRIFSRLKEMCRLARVEGPDYRRVKSSDDPLDDWMM